MISTSLIMTLIFTFVLGLVMIGVCKKLALQLDTFDHPNGTLKNHIKSIPNIGGVGIFITLITALLIVNYEMEREAQIYTELLGLIVIFITGVVDDQKYLSVKIRLLIQSAVALLLIVGGNIAHLTPWQPINLLITFVGIVASINAINLLDILDGLAGGVGLIITATLSYTLFKAIGFNLYVIYGLILIMALLAFLYYNFHPASIFMGDGGSTILGFSIALLFIKVINSAPHFTFKMAAIMAISLPFFELGFVSIMRMKKGLNPMMGSKDHFPLRVKQKVQTVKKTVLICYLITLLTSLFALIILNQTLITCLIVLSFLVATYSYFWSYLSKIPI